MKRGHTIGEVGELYGVSPNTLRFYEKLGLIGPTYRENGYRVYGETALWELTMTLALRKFNIPLAEIRDYFNNRSVAASRAVFSDGLERLNAQIDELEQLKTNLELCIEIIDSANRDNLNQVMLETRPERPCHGHFNVGRSLDDAGQLELEYQKFHLSYNAQLNYLGKTRLCCVVSSDKVMREGRRYPDIYDHAFYFVRGDAPYDRKLPAGHYLTYKYSGPRSMSAEASLAIWDYAERHGHTVLAEPVEVSMIDRFQTPNPDEWLTSVQVHVGE